MEYGTNRPNFFKVQYPGPRPEFDRKISTVLYYSTNSWLLSRTSLHAAYCISLYSLLQAHVKFSLLLCPNPWLLNKIFVFLLDRFGYGMTSLQNSNESICCAWWRKLEIQKSVGIKLIDRRFSTRSCWRDCQCVMKQTSSPRENDINTDSLVLGTVALSEVVKNKAAIRIQSLFLRALALRTMTERFTLVWQRGISPDLWSKWSQIVTHDFNRL